MSSSRTASYDASRDSNRARKLILAESVFSESQASSTKSVVLLAFALLLGANTFQIGLLSTAAMIGASLQLLSGRLLMWFGRRKRVAGFALAVLAVLKVALAMLPLAVMWIAAQHLAWGLLGGLIVISAAQQVAEVMRLSWIADIVPESERGRYLGNRHFYTQLAGSGVAIVAAWFVDWQGAISEARALVSVQTLFVIAASLSVVCIIILLRTPEPDVTTPPKARRWTIVPEPFTDTRFRPLMVHSALWNLAAPLIAPFFNLYLVSVLGMPFGVVAIYSFIGELSSIYSVRFWGRLIDRFGNLPVLKLCAGAKAIFPLLWLLLHPAESVGGKMLLYFLAGFVHIWRTFNSGQGVSTVNLALKLMPQDRTTSFLATFRTVGNWIHAVSPALAGAAATYLQGAGWSLKWSILVLAVASAAVRIISFWSLEWVKEPGAASFRRALRLMRRLPGFNPNRGWRAWMHFWGAPLFSGFSAARLRIGGLVNRWRGSITPEGD
jgi:MFS family permease